jgi:dephospho-CoA kinase
LGAKVFAEPAARAELEAQVHPLVRTALRDGIEQARARGVPVVVLDVPLLLENEAAHHLTDACDALVFVDADAKVREERARARRGPPSIARREALQPRSSCAPVTSSRQLATCRAACGRRVRATLGAS